MSVIQSVLNEERLFPPPAELARQANVPGMEAYQALCEEAERDYLGFWARMARENLLWKKPFTQVLDESNPPFYKWFYDGELNASYNCLDRHLETQPDKTAIIFETDDGKVSRITYRELYRYVCRFANALKAAQKAAESKSEDEIIASAAKLLEQAQTMSVPDFIRERLERLDDMIAMLRDEGWHLDDEDRRHVLSALVYFADPKDIIPDQVEVLGYLDDAIMIELCVRELRHELDAYDEFCEFREREAKKRGIEPSAVGRTDWLDARRDELVERMHLRRQRTASGEFGFGYGSSSGYGRPSYARAWRPSLFRVR